MPDYVADILSKLTEGSRIAPASNWLQWAKRIRKKELRSELRKAENRLTYTGSELKYGRLKEAEGESKYLATFECTISTRKKDRDGDVLEPSAAKPDPKMPLLWQHMWNEPIGAMIEVTKQNNARIMAKFGICDTQLGRDALTLVRGGALRISHGFNPTDYEPMYEKDADGKERFAGWHIKSYEILETSLVSVPSNTDAVISSLGKLHHPAVKSWAKSLGQVQPFRKGESLTAARMNALVDAVNAANGYVDVVEKLADQITLKGEATQAANNTPELSLSESFKVALAHLAEATPEQLDTCRRFVRTAQDLLDLMDRDELSFEDLLAA